MIVCMYVVYIAQSSSSSFQNTYNIFSNALSLCMRECFFLWLFGCRFFVPKIHKNRYNFVMTTTHKFAAITSVASTPRRLCNNNPLTIIRFSSSVHRFELLLFCCCQGVVVVDVLWLSLSVTLIAFYWLWPRTKTVLGQ